MKIDLCKFVLFEEGKWEIAKLDLLVDLSIVLD